MKRATGRAWPSKIVEVPPTTFPNKPDPRSLDTQKISREELEEALKRTKSGTRRAVRSDPSLEEPLEETIDTDLARTVQVEPFVLPREAPRDEGPEVTIVKIDTMEFEALDPTGMASAEVPRPAAIEPVPRPLTPAYDFGDDVPRTSTERMITQRKRTRRWQISPRAAFILGLVLVLFVTLAAGAGFLAGRGLLHLPH